MNVPDASWPASLVAARELVQGIRDMLVLHGSGQAKKIRWEKVADTWYATASELTHYKLLSVACQFARSADVTYPGHLTEPFLITLPAAPESLPVQWPSIFEEADARKKKACEKSPPEES